MIADIIVAAVLIVSGILAYIRGFVRETLTVSAWIGAVFATFYGWPHLSELLGMMIDTVWIAQVVSAALLFLVTLVALTILTHVVANRVKGSALGHLDYALGFVFGLLRGVVLVALLYIAATLFVDEREFPEAITEARTLPLVRTTAGLLVRLAPEDSLPNRDMLDRRVGNPVEGMEGAAKERLEEIIEEIDAEERLRRLTQPQPEAEPPDAETPPEQPQGYDDAERRDMQRLIESNQ